MAEYTSEARVRHPLKLMGEVADGLVRGHYFAYRLFIRDVRGQARGLRLGYLWNFGEPLVYALIFMAIREGDAIFTSGETLPLPLFVLMGLVPYHAFVQGTTRSMRIIEENAGLINQVRVQPEALVLSNLLRSVFDFSFALPVLGGLAMYFGGLGMGAFALACLAMSAAIPLAVGLGVALAPFASIYADISRFVALLLRPLMFLAPVFYTSDPGGIIARINQFIPLSTFIEESRSLLVTGHVQDCSAFWLHVGFSLLLLAVSTVFLNLSLPVLSQK